jgi:phosphoribosyl 1,2-cyclic phosphodiesterase
MSLFITSLNSGSNGNCYYVGDRQEAILVDAGLSCRETEKRMARLGLSIGSVKAIFISHEHTDHIFGLPVLSKKYQLPVYITERTRISSCMKMDPHLVHSFNAFDPIEVGSLSVHAFPKHHDAADPHSFIVSSANVRVGIFTDIGNTCNNVIDSFQKCHAVFLESNYDEGMLMNGRYPYYLKQRIRGGKGHLSNSQAFQLFTHHRSPFMSHLLLSHLSKENNTHEIVEQLFASGARDTKITVASRFHETPVYEVTANPLFSQPLPLRTQLINTQLSLF